MIRTLFCCVTSLPLVFFFSPEVFTYRSSVVTSRQMGSCIISLEANDEHALRVRVQPGHPQCYATSEIIQDILTTEFSRISGSEEVYTSISLGRVVDYPWLSEYLATSAYNDPEWKRNTGKPRSQGLYRYVSNVLVRSTFVDRLNEILVPKGYLVDGVTVEKILIGGFRDVPLYTGKMEAGRVPYDAMVWLRLRKK